MWFRLLPCIARFKTFIKTKKYTVLCEKTNKNMQDINQNKDCKRVKQALTKPKHIVLVKKPALTTVLSPNVHLWSSRPELFLERET